MLWTYFGVCERNTFHYTCAEFSIILIWNIRVRVYFGGGGTNSIVGQIRYDHLVLINGVQMTNNLLQTWYCYEHRNIEFEFTSQCWEPLHQLSEGLWTSASIVFRHLLQVLEVRCACNFGAVSHCHNKLCTICPNVGCWACAACRLVPHVLRCCTWTVVMMGSLQSSSSQLWYSYGDSHIRICKKR